MSYVLSVSSYTLVKNDSTCYELTSISECSNAAAALNLSDRTAEEDDQFGVTNAPTSCYLDGGVLKFNSKGMNTGVCTMIAQCVCRLGKYFKYVIFYYYGFSMFFIADRSQN